jgi:DedD protein
MAESEEALQLKRRARRRLVGAIALVTFVVIILPLILEKEA